MWIVIKLRGMMQGSATRLGFDHPEAMTNENVFKCWNLQPIVTELRIARLRWMQAWSAQPQLHGQVLGALVGKLRIEAVFSAEPPLGPNGRPTAAEFVFIFDDDLHALADVDEDFRETWDTSDWRDMFSGQDTAARRKLVAARTTAVPPPGAVIEPPPGLPATFSDTTHYASCSKCEQIAQGMWPT